MLKLLIVDDEEIICNTIASVTDWNALGITLVGTCLDGVEAYHTILDESPDIVMTDIRMPGISGLELIERISRTNLCTQFIILSGYGEFEYAKRAMKCGVRHYLLKPCDNAQIIDCITQIKEDCLAARQSQEMQNHDSLLLSTLHYTLMHNIISEGITRESIAPSFFDSYEKYLSFSDMPYQYCCIYFLEKLHLDACLLKVNAYFETYAPRVFVYKIYISNILVLFFPNFSPDYKAMDYFLKTLSFPDEKVSIKYERSPWPDLKSLLCNLIPKLKRYDILYFADGEKLIPNFNYESLMSQAKQLCCQLFTPPPGRNRSQRRSFFPAFFYIQQRIPAPAFFPDSHHPKHPGSFSDHGANDGISFSSSA